MPRGLHGPADGRRHDRRVRKARAKFVEALRAAERRDEHGRAGRGRDVRGDVDPGQ